MPISKLIQWARDLGYVVKPDDVKLQGGWVGGDQPPASYENWHNSQQDMRINKLSDGTEGYPDGMTWDDIVAKRFDISAEVYPANVSISLSGTPDVTEICIHRRDDQSYAHRDHTYYLVLAENNAEIICVDAETHTTVQTIDVTTGLGAGTWEANAMCVDAEYVYVVFTETGATTHWVQAYQIDLDSATWAVKSGWPANGTQLIDISTPPTVVGQKQAGIIHADNTSLAIASCWRQTVSSSAHAAIQLINKTTGAISSSGGGDVGSIGSNVIITGQLTSDGTNIYYGVYAPSGGLGFVCTATIASLTTGSGITGYPFTQSSPDSYAVGDIMAIGDKVYASWTSRTILTSSAAPSGVNAGYITVGSSTAASHRRIVFTSTVYSDDRYRRMSHSFGRMAFDGLHLWVYTLSDTAYVAATRIDIATLEGMDSLIAPEFVNPQTHFLTGNAIPDTKFFALMPIVFDNDHIVTTPYTPDGAFGSNRLRLVTKGMAR